MTQERDSTGSAEVLVMTSQLNDSDSRADNRGFAETVLVTGEGLVGILNDTLEFAKIEAGRLDLQVHRL